MYRAEFGTSWLTLALIVWVTSAQADMSLKFGVYTRMKPTEMVAQFRPLLEALETRLSEKLGQRVHITMPGIKTYEQGIQAIATGEVDIAELGPASYVKATEANPKLSILAIETKHGATLRAGVICVHKDSSIQTV